MIEISLLKLELTHMVGKSEGCTDLNFILFIQYNSHFYSIKNIKWYEIGMQISHTYFTSPRLFLKKI